MECYMLELLLCGVTQLEQVSVESQSMGKPTAGYTMVWCV